MINLKSENGKVHASVSGNSSDIMIDIISIFDSISEILVKSTSMENRKVAFLACVSAYMDMSDDISDGKDTTIVDYTEAIKAFRKGKGYD